MSKYKSLIKFIIVILISGALGGFASSFLSRMDTHTFAQILSNFLITYSPYMLTVSVIGVLAFATYFYQKAKHIYKRNNLDDDESYGIVDHSLTISMTLCSFVFVVSFLFFGIFAAGISHIDSNDRSVLPCFVLTLTVFIGGSFGSIFLQTRAVQMAKLLSPNKKGDPLDLKFSKDWLESCDEAEQYVIFRSAYAAYQAVQKCILGFWIIAVFGALLFGTGILPVIIVAVLWGVLIMSYTFTANKLEKTKLR